MYLTVMMLIHRNFSATDCSKSCGCLIVRLYKDIRQGKMGRDYGMKHEFAFFFYA